MGDAKSEVYELLEAEGAKLLRRRKHLVYLLPGGKRVVLPGSPSCARAWKNKLAWLKRELRS